MRKVVAVVSSLLFGCFAHRAPDVKPLPQDTRVQNHDVHFDGKQDPDKDHLFVCGFLDHGFRCMDYQEFHEIMARLEAKENQL